MATITKRFNPSSLARVAIIVGSIHILGSLWNSIGILDILVIEPEEFSDGDKIGAIINITITSLFGLAGALLIIGSYKKCHLMLLPWLILEGVSLVLFFVYNAMVSVLTDDLSLGHFAIVMVNLSLIALCAYVWYAILTFYTILRDEKQKQPIQDDEERLCEKQHPSPVRDVTSYPPAYVIPITFADPKKTISLIKY